MKRLIFTVIIVVLVLTNCKQETTTEIQVVSIEEMQELLAMDNIQLVDVRTPEEYMEGFIADFQNIDFLSPTFDDDILKLDKEKPVMLYCRSGGRSAKCAKKMLEAGFVKIYDLDGGITKWIHDGHEVEVLN